MARNPRYNRISIVLDEFQIDQKDFANLINVTKDTVSRWCRNENQPRVPELFRIAGIFRIEVARLLVSPNWDNETGPSPYEIFKQEQEQMSNRRKPVKRTPPSKKRRAPKKKK